jgi:deoxyribodipyrimidine photo-lyase
MKNSLVWFRQDLRVSDNPALNYAINNSEKVAAIYIHDEETVALRKLGGATKWWLNYALQDLAKSLKEKFNIELYFAEGASQKILENIIAENNINLICWNRLYEPYNTERDSLIKESLSCEVKSFNGSLLSEPWEVKNGSGSYFKVFTHFYKNCLANHKPREVEKTPENCNKSLKINSNKLVSLEDLNLKPTKPNWAKKLYSLWDISEKAAQDRLYDFLETAVEKYADNRNHADIEGTSKISPYLHIGQISPHQIYSVCSSFAHKHRQAEKGVEKFINEIYWREFSYSLLYNYPIHEKNFRPEFDNFEWDENQENLRAWQKGLTGYPIVDAGMRELYETGWMHNRVRMIVGSFLTKDLIIHWKEGEEWFWDTLLDADLANNSASWQWVAGSGADAAPYFRIFNPVMQGQKFDTSGEYVRKWCPELKLLPNQFLHNPWEAPELVLKAAGVELGKNYPKLIVDHKEARNRALASFAKTKKN